MAVPMTVTVPSATADDYTGARAAVVIIVIAIVALRIIVAASAAGIRTGRADTNADPAAAGVKPNLRHRRRRRKKHRRRRNPKGKFLHTRTPSDSSPSKEK